jgi:regulator of RNase E activity RraA
VSTAAERTATERTATERTNAEAATRFATLTTPHLVDACLRLGIEVRCAPFALRAVTPGRRFIGRVAPAQHAGSVDVFLEAIDRASPGDVLVIDNAARTDESCVGDLATLEVAGAGLAAIVIWGLHRDTGEIVEIGLPVFSLGSLPTGPQRLDPRAADALERARVGDWMVSPADLVAADDDGAIFIPVADAARVFEAAETIRDTERRQAALISSGRSLRDQVRFSDYLTDRDADPTLTFRDHLRAVGGEIEV